MVPGWLAAPRPHRISRRVTSHRFSIRPIPASSSGLKLNRYRRGPLRFPAHRTVNEQGRDRDDSGGGDFLASSVSCRRRQANRSGTRSDEGADGRDRTGFHCKEVQHSISGQAAGQLTRARTRHWSGQARGTGSPELPKTSRSQKRRVVLGVAQTVASAADRYRPLSSITLSCRSSIRSGAECRIPMCRRRSS